MWERLKRIWKLGDYEVVTDQNLVGYGKVPVQPRLKVAEPAMKRMATIVDMEDTIARDFKSEEE